MDEAIAVRTLRFGPRLIREQVEALEGLLVEVIDAADTLGEDASGERELLGRLWGEGNTENRVHRLSFG